MSDYLLSLPLELLEYTFYTFVEPYDIAAVNQTCKALHAVTGTASAFFWRNLFLSQPYDDPRSHSSKARSTFDWRGVVTSRVRAERTKTEAPLLDALTECVRNIPPHSATPSADIAWAEKMIGLHLDVFEDYPLPNCESDITSEELVDIKVDLALVDPIAAEKRMLIRSLFSQRLRPSSYTASARRRTARAFVYNMRNYTESSRYGPLLSGASAPSWTHVDALVTVIAANLSDFGDEWPAQLRPPALLRGAESLRAYSGTRVRTSPVDWAGIEGEWLRVVCFCDYRDLIRFNRGRCRPDFFHDEFEEATRLLRLRLTCTGIAAGEDSADPVRPALRFEGRMHGLSSHESLARGVRGVVRVMPNGDIRWSFVSFYEGEEQWSSEGVQLGGAGSAAGVVGAWSGASHSPSDPAGPFWLFKVNDESALDKIHAWPL